MHQSFVSPDPEVRAKNVEHNIKCIVAVSKPRTTAILAVPSHHGTWNSSDERHGLETHGTALKPLLELAYAIEPRLEGYIDEDGFGWVFDGLTCCFEKVNESDVAETVTVVPATADPHSA